MGLIFTIWCWNKWVALAPGREVAAAACSPELHPDMRENQDRGRTLRSITTKAAGSRIPKGRGTKHSSATRKEQWWWKQSCNIQGPGGISLQVTTYSSWLNFRLLLAKAAYLTGLLACQQSGTGHCSPRPTTYCAPCHTDAPCPTSVVMGARPLFLALPSNLRLGNRGQGRGVRPHCLGLHGLLSSGAFLHCLVSICGAT